MARWRAIHKKISISGQVNRMSEFAQFLFERAMLHADDWGVVTGDPWELKAQAMPLSERTPEEFEAALTEMHEQGLIWQYHPDGYGPLIQFINFDEYQPQILIGNRSDPKKPLHHDHPDYPSFPGLHWKTMEKTGKPCNSMEVIEKTSTSKSKSKSKSSKSKSRTIQPKSKKPDTDHHKLVDFYLQQISKGYEKRYPGKFKGDLKAIKAMLARGRTAEEVEVCYLDFKAEAFWARQHLSMMKIDQNIDDWLKARRESKRGPPKRNKAKESGRRDPELEKWAKEQDRVS